MSFLTHTYNHSLSYTRTPTTPLTHAQHPPHLRTGVTELECKRPANFEYKSGQWLRIAVTSLGREDYHPLTISSSPHQNTLKLYIQVGFNIIITRESLLEIQSYSNKRRSHNVQMVLVMPRTKNSTNLL